MAGAQPGSRIDGTAASGAATGAAAPGKDVVDLSSAARHLSNLQNSGNDINIERVNELRAAIASGRSEEHTSELQSLMRLSYAVFCLKKKNISLESHTHIY